MLDTVFASLKSQATAWSTEAERRRQRSHTDPVADTLVNCAAELTEQVRLLETESEWLTPEQYGAQHFPIVSGQTVRNWIHRGELKAEDTPRGYRIARREARRRKRSVA